MLPLNFITTRSKGPAHPTAKSPTIGFTRVKSVLLTLHESFKGPKVTPPARLTELARKETLRSATAAPFPYTNCSTI
jgi:hypothetical protein